VRYKIGLIIVTSLRSRTVFVT